jgi:hypothetical protein
MAPSVRHSSIDGVEPGEEQATELIRHNSNQQTTTADTMAPGGVTQTPTALSQGALFEAIQEGHESEPDEHEIFTQLAAVDLPKIKRRTQPKEDRTNVIIYIHMLGQAAMHVKSLDPRWRVGTFGTIDQLFYLTSR